MAAPTGYARMIKPTGATARISALTTHQIASGSPRRLASRPLTAKIIPATTLTIATDSAIRPRLKQPRTSPGVEAVRKKAAGDSRSSNNLSGEDRCSGTADRNSETPGYR